MELIRQNPYNVIGILAGANQKIIARQKSKINAFQKVGKRIAFDTDLQFAGNADRSNGAIEKAFSNIEINQNKLFNALFWLANHNHLDETALAYLQSGDYEKAEDIWEKITNGKEVSVKNFTAFNNLGTLKLAIAFTNGTLDFEKLKEGIRLKTALLTSNNFSDFCHLVADETYTVDQDKELEVFIHALLEEASKLNGLEAKSVPVLIGSIHPTLKSIVSEKLTDAPIHNIERKTAQTKKKRSEDPRGGLLLARLLYRNLKGDLATLSELLGKSDLKYQMVADKLAKELLQCGIDYFKVYQEEEERHSGDLGEDVIQLFKIAKSIAIGSQTRERIAENIGGLKEWINDAGEREKQKKVEEDLTFVATKLERFQRLPDTIANADDLATSCQSRLQRMKGILGAYDDFYLKISSAIVNNVQGMLVTVINKSQEDPLVRMGRFDGLKAKINAAIRVSEKIGTFDMVSELRNQYNKNHQTLKSLSSQLSAVGARTSSGGSGGGCYIATMAYGSYEHPQVLELRKFRDERLKKSVAGRSFIQLYYWFSPKLAKLLRGNRLINTFIRRILNQLIEQIK